MQFTRYSSVVKPGGVGRAVRAAHDPVEKWPACAVYCEKEGGGFYAPVAEMSAARGGIDAFFPDGTECHSEVRGNRAI